MAKAVRREIERLRREIRQHDYLYYVEAAPKISDLAYDRLRQRLAALEQEHPELVAPDSPTQRVAGAPISSFRPARHHVPMLSIDNTYSEAERRQFDERVRRGLKSATPQYVVEHKIDGVSVSLIYERGTLITDCGDWRNPGTVYDYTTSRTRDGPADFLATFAGYLHADAFAGSPEYSGVRVIALDNVIDFANPLQRLTRNTYPSRCRLTMTFEQQT